MTIHSPKFAIGQRVAAFSSRGPYGLVVVPEGTVAGYRLHYAGETAKSTKGIAKFPTTAYWYRLDNVYGVLGWFHEGRLRPIQDDEWQNEVQEEKELEYS